MTEVVGRARPRKQRAGMAAIRGLWTFVLPGVGFVLTYLIDNIINLGIVTLPVALAIGAVAYSLKRYWFPDSTF